MKRFPILIALCTLTSMGLAGCGCSSESTPIIYTVSFKNYDGSLLSESKVEKGHDAIYEGVTPTRGETSEYTYTFNGWDQSLENIQSDCIRVAQFTETYKPVTTYYTVFFVNYDGSSLFEASVAEGGKAIYEGTTPTRPETEEYSYSFTGWDKSLDNITSDCVRVAQYSETAKPVTKYYTVTFQNYDGTVITTDVVEEGHNATYTGPALTRPETTEYTYTFSGWDKSLENITSDCVRVAQFSATAKPVAIYYTVTFKNFDGAVLKEVSVEAGHNVTYGGSTPTRPETTEYTYTFKGWDQSLDNITSNCVRIAQYTETAKPVTPYYTVTFKNYDDSILHQALVIEGGNATYGGATPTRPSNAEFSYTFKGWDQTLNNITSNCIRVAQYDESYIEYTVKFYNDEELLYIDTVHYQEPAYYDGVPPTKESTATHHYTFVGWNKDISCITESINVKAVFSEHGDDRHIILNPNNGQDSDEIEVTFDEAYNLGTPSFPGFIFLGWYSGETLIPTSGVWQYSGVSSVTAKWQNVYFIFTENTDGTYTVSLNDEGKAATEIVIPSYYEGVQVTALGTDFLRANENIKKVTIPGSIGNIPNYSFYNCKKLSEVVLNNGLITIGEYAFSYCAITKLIVPSTCTTIGRQAFDYNSSLYHIYIPSSVQTIGAYAFDSINSYAYICLEHESVPSGFNGNWTKSTYYTFSTSLVETEEYNYLIRNNYGDLSVTILRLSEETKKLQNYAFPSEIEGISDIKVGRYLFYNNQYIRNVDLTGVIRIGYSAFESCKNLASVTFSNSLTYIDTNAFRYCSALIRVEIPESVTEIGSYAFDTCSGLTYVYVPKTTATIGAYAFDLCGSAIIYTNAHSALSGWNSNWNRYQAIYYDFVSVAEEDDFNYVIQSYMGEQYVTITGMKASAKEKKNIVIPNEIAGISDICLKSSLFNGFTELVSVNLGSGVKSVPTSCFESCSKLESVILHTGVTNIGQKAFYNCEKLLSITMPSTLTTIGKQAFDYCKGLREVEIPISVTTIGAYAFDVTGKTALLIQASVKQSGWDSNWAGSTTTNKQFVYDYVSRGVVGELRYAKASNGVTDAIYILGLVDGSLATNLVIPDQIDGVSNILIANVAFDGNTILKTVDLGNNVTYIGANAFRNNSSLASVIIPLSCSVIKNNAFQYCSLCTLNCEIDAKPDGWETNWNYSSCPVVWSYVR